MATGETFSEYLFSVWKASQKNFSSLVNFTSLIVICNLVFARISLLDYIHKILTSLMAKRVVGGRGAPVIFLDIPLGLSIHWWPLNPSSVPDVLNYCLIFLFLLLLFTCVVIVVT